MNTFSHLDKKGNVRMVDVTDKVSTTRVAKAKGQIDMLNKTISAIQDDTLPKGNVLPQRKLPASRRQKKQLHSFPCVTN